MRVSGKQNSLFPLGPVIKCLLSFVTHVMSVVCSQLSECGNVLKRVLPGVAYVVSSLGAAVFICVAKWHNKN